MARVTPKHKKLIKLGLYIGLIVTALFWLCFGTTRYWNTTYQKVLSNNAAVLTEVVSTIDNLEGISTIEPSKTSGNLPGIANAYKAAAESAAADRLVSPNVLTTGLHSRKKAVKTVNKEATEALEATNYRLENVAEGLTITQKFIEYAPAVDLELYKNGQETDASERLARTQAGIQNTIKAVEESKLPYRKDVLEVLRPLEKKAIAVTPQTVDAWADEVLKAQKQILVIIQTDYDNNISAPTQKLRDVAEQYLQLR